MKSNFINFNRAVLISRSTLSYKHFDYEDNLIAEKVRRGFIKSGKTSHMNKALKHAYLFSRTIEGLNPYENYSSLTTESLPTSKFIYMKLGRKRKKLGLILGSKRASSYKDLVLENIKKQEDNSLGRKLYNTLNHFRYKNTEKQTIITKVSPAITYTTKKKKKEKFMINKKLKNKTLEQELTRHFLDTLNNQNKQRILINKDKNKHKQNNKT